MRIVKTLIASFCLAATFVKATEVAEEEKVEQPEDDDVDWDDEDEVNALIDENSGSEISLDANLSDSDRKVRMSACIDVARSVFAGSKDEIQATIDALKEAYKLEDEKAIEMMHIAMIKNCYINFDQEKDVEAIMKVLKEENSNAWKELSNRLVSKPEDEDESGSEFAPRHWELIRQIIYEENDQKRKETVAPKIKVVGSDMTSLQKVLYLMVVFGSIFGGGYWLVKKLIKKELDKQNKRGKKKSN